MTVATQTLNTELTAREAMALSQFIKRLGWTEVRARATSSEEAGLMQDALNKIQQTLGEQGVVPR